VLKRDWQAIFSREIERCAQGLVDQHFPNPGKDFAPSTLSIPDVTFIVNVVRSTVGHKMMIVAVEVALCVAAKEFTFHWLGFISAMVRGNRRSPFVYQLIMGEAPFLVKDSVKAGHPSFGCSWTVSPIESMAEDELMEASPWVSVSFWMNVPLVPAELVGQVLMAHLLRKCPYIQSVQPRQWDVLPWETERSLRKQEVLKTLHVV
jgi:hypothetical protein